MGKKEGRGEVRVEGSEGKGVEGEGREKKEREEKRMGGREGYTK